MPTMSEHTLCFSDSATDETGLYKLMELPPDLLHLVETSIEIKNPLWQALAVKGIPNDDAVICTLDKTYSLRSVVLSNSILVVTPPADENGTIMIRDQVREIMEVALTVPKLHKVSSILKGQVYSGNEDEDMDIDNGPQPYTLQMARAQIQASDVELERGLRERRILEIDGNLRPISLTYLQNILELVLNVLVAESFNRDSVPIEKLTRILLGDHAIPPTVSTQIISWFGVVNGAIWSMNTAELVKEMGLSILRNHKDRPVDLDVFMASWRSKVGDTFESLVDLSLLLGNYLLSTSALEETKQVSYFPASLLPTEPAARFGDLFVTRSRWKGKDIEPFLDDISINSKERDKLLLKYARAISGPGGMTYTARAQYNG